MSGGHPLRLGHRDEVHLERREHVGAQQPHVDRDLGNGQRDDREAIGPEVLAWVVEEADVFGDGREPPPLDREEVEEHHPDDVARH